MITGLSLEQFQPDPPLFLERAIKDYVAGSSSNRLRAFSGEHIFDEPLVGFANGDDAIFHDYKVIIGDFHFTPGEVLERHLRCKGCGDEKQPRSVSVISWILPIAYDTRLSLRRESLVSSLRWNHTRWQGGDFINKLSHYVVSLVKELGYQAVAPELADFYEMKELSSGLVSNWSQRHIAFAASCRL